MFKHVNSRCQLPVDTGGTLPRQPWYEFWISVVSCCWKVIIRPHILYFFSCWYSTLMSYFSDVQALVAKIFVFPGWILSPTFSVLRLKSQKPLRSCSLEDANRSTYVVSKYHVCEAIMVPVDHVEKQALQRSACLVPFLTSNMLLSFVSQYWCFLVSVKFLQEVNVIMFDTAGFEGIPNWFVCDGVECLREVPDSVHIFDSPLVAISEESLCTSQDDLSFGMSSWIPPDLPLFVKSWI